MCCAAASSGAARPHCPHARQDARPGPCPATSFYHNARVSTRQPAFAPLPEGAKAGAGPRPTSAGSILLRVCLDEIKHQKPCRILHTAHPVPAGVARDATPCLSIFIPTPLHQTGIKDDTKEQCARPLPARGRPARDRPGRLPSHAGQPERSLHLARSGMARALSEPGRGAPAAARPGRTGRPQRLGQLSRSGRLRATTTPAAPSPPRQPAAHTGYYAPLASWFEARAFPARDGIVLVLRDVSHVHAKISQLRYQATHDYLTGLPNRRQLMDTLSGAIAEAAAGLGRQRTLLAVFLDLDRFKEVNDTFGHAEGDALRDGPSGCAASRPRPSSARAPAATSSRWYCATPPNAPPRRWPTPAEPAVHAAPDPRPPGIAGREHRHRHHEFAGRFRRRAAGLRRRGVRGQGRRPLPGARLPPRTESRLAGAQRCAATSRPRWTATSSSCISSPRSTCATALSAAPRRCCAGAIRRAGLLGPASFLDVLLDSPQELALTEWVVDTTCWHLSEWLTIGLPILSA